MTEGGTVQSYTLPPPVGGLKTRDPFSQADPLSAIELRNFFPNRATVDQRKGARYHSKTIGTGIVYGIGAFESGATSKLVATGVSAGTYRLYDATTASAAATILTNDAGVTMTAPCLYYQQFRDYLYATSGQLGDTFQRWAGSGNVFASFTGLNAPGPMTVYRSRMYCLDMLDSGGNPAGTSVWYGATDAVTGAMTEFPLKSLLRLGGNYGIIATVTRAKDFSEDELFCYISLNGEVLIYQGDYPGSVTWSLLGHYVIPRPLGVRAFFYVGPDLHVMTTQGVVSLQSVMRGDRIGSKYLTISDNIDETLIDTVTSSNLGSVYWVGVESPKNNLLIVTVPNSPGTTSVHYVMNTSSGAWAYWDNFNAFCWTQWNNEIYFGTTNSRVFKACTGTWDENPASEGAAVDRTHTMRQSFNYLDDRANHKSVLQLSPIIYSENGLAIRTGVDVDFSNTAIGSTLEYSDTSDLTGKIYRPTIQAQGSGKGISHRIDAIGQTSAAKLYATEVFYETGGPFA